MYCCFSFCSTNKTILRVYSDAAVPQATPCAESRSHHAAMQGRSAPRADAQHTPRTNYILHRSLNNPSINLATPATRPRSAVCRAAPGAPPISNTLFPASTYNGPKALLARTAREVAVHDALGVQVGHGAGHVGRGGHDAAHVRRARHRARHGAEQASVHPCPAHGEALLRAALRVCTFCLGVRSALLQNAASQQQCACVRPSVCARNMRQGHTTHWAHKSCKRATRRMPAAQPAQHIACQALARQTPRVQNRAAGHAPPACPGCRTRAAATARRATPP